MFQPLNFTDKGAEAQIGQLITSTQLIMVVLPYSVVLFTLSNGTRISPNNVQWSATGIQHIAKNHRNSKQNVSYNVLALKTDAGQKGLFKRVGALDVFQVACPSVIKSSSCSLRLITDWSMGDSQLWSDSCIHWTRFCNIYVGKKVEQDFSKSLGLEMFI